MEIEHWGLRKTTKTGVEKLESVEAEDTAQ